MIIIITRTLILYFLLLLSMRLLGKRQLGEMELSEFVVAAMMADLAAHPLQEMGIPLLNGLIPVIVLFCCEIIIAGLAMKSIRLRALFFGKPSILITRGEINQQEMHKNRFTIDELMEELRTQGFDDISQVEYAVLETDGDLNVIAFPAERPVTPAQLGIDAGPGGYPIIIICEGRVLEANLKHLGLDRKWLDKELKKRKIKDTKDVYLMMANRSGQIYFAQREESK